MKRSTLLSTAAVLALSTTLAMAEGMPREQQRQEPSNAPAAQQQTPSQQPSSSQSSQAAQPQQQEPANRNAQREPAQAQPNNQRAQQPAQQNNRGAQREPSQAQPNNQRAQQPAQQNNQNAQREPAQAQPNNQRAQQPVQQNSRNAQREPAQTNQPARNRAESNQQPAQRGTEARQSGQAQRSAQISSEQRTRIASSIRQQRVSPVRVNFALNVGAVVPRSVRIAALPASIVSSVPQYRGYSYFVTDEQIVIVEPSSHYIVEVLPYQGGSRTAAAPMRSERREHFTEKQRADIKRFAVERRTATTTGSGPRERIVVDEEVPAAVELEEFPETVVREVPSVRTYRYFRQDNDVVVVDPGSRRVIDVIE
jgi:hypothetical protein